MRAGVTPNGNPTNYCGNHCLADVRLILRRAYELDVFMSEGPHWRLRSECAIAVMAKASIAGKTKTRLVPPLTEAEAAGLNTVFLQDAADNVLSAAARATVSGWMAYAPVGSEPFFRSYLPESIGLIETVAPTLGGCLCQAAGKLLAAGHGAVCLINSDSPTLPAAYLIAAAAALVAPGDRVVLGPSTDGGYYLIGMKRLHAGLFEGIAWSTGHVFAQTRARAQVLGLSVFELPTWYDVDNTETLRTLIGELLDRKPFRRLGTPAPATWTRRYLSTLIKESGLRGRLRASSAAGRLAK
jgi:rSAM/selenodomain-associated transferase 1